MLGHPSIIPHSFNGSALHVRGGLDQWQQIPDVASTPLPVSYGVLASGVAQSVPANFFLMSVA